MALGGSFGAEKARSMDKIQSNKPPIECVAKIDDTGRPA